MSNIVNHPSFIAAALARREEILAGMRARTARRLGAVAFRRGASPDGGQSTLWIGAHPSRRVHPPGDRCGITGTVAS